MRDTSQALITLTGEISEFGYSSFFFERICLSLCQNHNFLFVFVFEVYVSKFQVFHCVRVDPRCGRSLSFPRCVYHLWVQGEFIFISVFCLRLCLCKYFLCSPVFVLGFSKTCQTSRKNIYPSFLFSMNNENKLNIVSVIGTLLRSFQSGKRKYTFLLFNVFNVYIQTLKTKFNFE